MTYAEWARVLAQVSSPAAPALILLTATINTPEGMPALQRVDPAARRADYETALAFYLGLSSAAVDRVVLAENSDDELGSLQRIAQARGAGKQVELISFADPDFPEERAVELVDQCHRRGVMVRIAPSTMEILVHRAEFVPGASFPLF